MSLPGHSRDEDTPIASLVGFKRQYIASWKELYREFFRQIGLELWPDEIGGGKSGSGYNASRKLFSEISQGVRRLDWCPAGLSLYGNLHAFFLARGMDFCAYDDFTQGRLLNLVTTESIWLVVSESRYFFSSKEHKVSVHDSGVYDDLRLPSVLQLSFLLAAAIYRHKKIAAVSLRSSQPLFIRSSTVIGPASMIATAYEPGKGLIFKAFPISYSGTELVNMDAFILP